jgi:hypothetical protein
LDTIKVCSELFDRLTDDNLPDGTLIKLSSELEMSHLDKALDINNKKRLPKIEKNRKSGVQTLNRPPHALAKLKMLRGRNGKAYNGSRYRKDRIAYRYMG